MSLESLFRQAGIAYAVGGEHRNVRTGWIGIDCPWCGFSGEGKFHLGISLSPIHTVCWNCGGHSLPSVICELFRVGYGQAHRMLLEADVQLDQISKPSVDAPVTGELKLPKGREPLGIRHRRYLRKRGFDPDEIAHLWGIEGIGINSMRLCWRIFIPIYLGNRIVSWTTRAIMKNATQRYITASREEEAISCKHVLYGAQHAKDRIVIGEGPTDAWRLGPGAVATLGLVVSPVQIELMSRYHVRAICFDNSRGAQLRAEKLANQLEMLPGETHVIQLDSDDLGCASDNEIRQIRRTILKER